MKHFLFTGIAVLSLLAFGIGGLSQCDGQPDLTEIRSNDPNEYDYLFFRPESESPLPLLVFLHGSGETGKGFDRLRKCNPYRYGKKVILQQSITFAVACPLAGREGWNSEKLARLVETLCRDRRIDPDRVYLTGFSMGGGATFRIACNRPDLFAAIVPVAGGAYPGYAEALQDMPVWAFHGENDEIIPLWHSSDMIEAIREAGNDNVRLTVLPGAGHGIAADVYGREELYRWLLKQRRNKRETVE